MYKYFFLSGFIFFFLSFTAFAQDYIWTGHAENHDFFDETNWNDTSTNMPPETGSITTEADINKSLAIVDVSLEVLAGSPIRLGNGSLTLQNSSLAAVAITGGSVKIETGGYLALHASNALSGNTSFDFSSAIAWLKLPNIYPNVVLTGHITQFTIKEEPAIYTQNLRIDNYYAGGAMVRMEDATATPLVIYDQPDLDGDGIEVTVQDFHRGSEIPGGMNNKTASFILKRGYMATMAENDDGTGLSRVFIAQEEDLVVHKLPIELTTGVSFIRVIPWNWVSKKGIARTGTSFTGLNETWFYNWGNSAESTIHREFAPMTWGHTSATRERLEALIDKHKVTHIMGFNEPDDCHGQSGQWGNLCQVDVAVAIYENLMTTGLRLVSPGPREQGPFGWLKEFHEKATERSIRIDVIAVHWYDWGSNPQNTPDADPQQVFNRFRNYLNRVYEHYQLPIWITEFNANRHRNTHVHEGFLELALPYLESLHYVERYSWFETSSGHGEFYYEDGSYTHIGEFYRDQQSNPSVVGASLMAPSNLNGIDPEMRPPAGTLYRDFFEQYNSGQNLSSFYTVGNGQAYVVDVNTSTSHGTAFEGDKFGRSNNTSNGFFIQKTFTLEPGKTYVWELATRMAGGGIHRMEVLPSDIYSGKDFTNGDWQTNRVEFTVTESHPEVTLSLTREPKTILYFDNFILKEKKDVTSAIDHQHVTTHYVRVYPNPVADILRLETHDNNQDKIRIYNINGTLIKQLDYTKEINVSHLKQGVYFLRINNSTVRFVKL